MFLSRRVVGLEFDMGCIRAVEIKGRKNYARVVAAGEVFLPPTAFADGIIKDKMTVCAALNKLWRKAKIGSRRLVLGFFNHGVLVRHITFPKVPRDKLDSALRLQAGEYLPLPAEEMVLDYAVLGEATGFEGEVWEILLVAAKKEDLLHNINVLEQCKLETQVIDATPFALQRVLPVDKLMGATIIVNLAMDISSMVLVIDGMSRLARVIPVALGQYLSQFGAVAPLSEEVLNLAAVGAEPGAGESEVLRTWAGGIAKEIRTAISFFVRQNELQHVDRVILCGIGAGVSGINTYLQEELGIAVEIVEPTSQLKIKEKIKSNLMRPEFAASIGLALRGLEV